MKRLFLGFPFFLLLASLSSLHCVTTYRGISPDPLQMHYPIGIAVHPSGRFLYIANSNFDLAYTGGSLMVFSTEETKTAQGSIQGVKTDFKSLALLPQATVEIGSFAGQMLMNREGTQLYLAVRNDRREDRPIDLSSLMIVNVDITKEDNTHLSCDQKPVKKEESGGVGKEAKFDNEPAPRCGDKSKVFVYGKRCKIDQDCPLNVLPLTTTTATTAAASNNPTTQNQNQTANQFERCLKDDGAEIGYCATNFYPYTMSLLSACTPKRTCQEDATCLCSADAKAQGLCTDDETCDEGRCVSFCKAASDCKGGATCQKGRCVLALLRSCQAATDCLPNEICDGQNQCIEKTCVGEADCPGFVCKSGLCSRKACQRDLECPAGQRCDLQRCVPGCAETKDCPQGQTCFQSRCGIPPSSLQRFCEDATSCHSWEKCLEQRLFASHLEFGGYSDISLAKFRFLPQDSQERREIGLVQEKTLKLPTAVTGLSILPNTTGLGGLGEILLSSRIDNRIFALPLQEEIPGTSPAVEIPLLNVQLTRPDLADLRSLLIAEDRKRGWTRLYVASRFPTSILVYDVFRASEDSPPSFSLVGTIPLGAEVGAIYYRRRPAPEPDLLYLVCSLESRIDVVDTESMRVVHQIEVGERPSFLAFYEPTVTSTVQRSRAYVTNFIDTSISIIDLQTHRVIGLIKGIETSLKVSP